MLTVVAALLCVALAMTALAHSGGTDENGGHIDHSTGEYHYHHGYPEHQHTGGVCPYDFDDKTGENSGTSGGRKEPSRVVSAKKSSDRSRIGSWVFITIVFTIPLCVFIIYPFLSLAVKSLRQRFASQKKKKFPEGGRIMQFIRERKLRVVLLMVAIAIAVIVDVIFAAKAGKVELLALFGLAIPILVPPMWHLFLTPLYMAAKDYFTVGAFYSLFWGGPALLLMMRAVGDSFPKAILIVWAAGTFVSLGIGAFLKR